MLNICEKKCFNHQIITKIGIDIVFKLFNHKSTLAMHILILAPICNWFFGKNAIMLNLSPFIGDFSKTVGFSEKSLPLWSVSSKELHFEYQLDYVSITLKMAKNGRPWPWAIFCQTWNVHKIRSIGPIFKN